MCLRLAADGGSNSRRLNFVRPVHHLGGRTFHVERAVGDAKLQLHAADHGAVRGRIDPHRIAHSFQQVRPQLAQHRALPPTELDIFLRREVRRITLLIAQVQRNSRQVS